jgi:hypothetical protein
MAKNLPAKRESQGLIRGHKRRLPSGRIINVNKGVPARRKPTRSLGFRNRAKIVPKKPTVPARRKNFRLPPRIREKPRLTKEQLTDKFDYFIVRFIDSGQIGSNFLSEKNRNIGDLLDTMKFMWRDRVNSLDLVDFELSEDELFMQFEDVMLDFIERDDDGWEGKFDSETYVRGNLDDIVDDAVRNGMYNTPEDEPAIATRHYDPFDGQLLTTDNDGLWENEVEPSKWEEVWRSSDINSRDSLKREDTRDLLIKLDIPHIEMNNQYTSIIGIPKSLSEKAKKKLRDAGFDV